MRETQWSTALLLSVLVACAGDIGDGSLLDGGGDGGQDSGGDAGSSGGRDSGGDTGGPGGDGGDGESPGGQGDGGGIGGMGGDGGGGGSDGGSGGGDAGSDAGSGVDTGSPRWVGVNSFGYRVASSDGVVWTEVYSEPQGGDDHTPYLLRDIAFANGTFVAVGGDRNGRIMTSADGQTWEEDRYANDPNDAWLGGVAYDNGVWVAVGGCWGARSTDNARTWSSVGWIECNLRALAGGGGVFVAVGDNGMVFTSQDQGQDWTNRTLAGGPSFTAATFGHGRFVATSSNRCMISSNGTSWEDCPFGTGSYGRPSFSGGRLVVPLGQGYAVTSDGATWSTGQGAFPTEVVYAGGKWVGWSPQGKWQGPDLDSLTLNTAYPGSLRGFAGGGVDP